MKIIKGLSLKLDSLFFRNLTLILASIFIWRGVFFDGFHGVVLFNC
jgi:hypothetical protein